MYVPCRCSRPLSFVAGVYGNCFRTTYRTQKEKWVPDPESYFTIDRLTVYTKIDKNYAQTRRKFSHICLKSSVLTGTSGHTRGVVDIPVSTTGRSRLKNSGERTPRQENCCPTVCPVTRILMFKPV